MKKTLHLLFTLAASLIILTACISCGSKDPGNSNTDSPGSPELLSFIEITSTYHGETRTFTGRVNYADKTISLNLPSNITSWSNTSVKFSLSSTSTSMQINGTGTAYIPKASYDSNNTWLGTCIYITDFSLSNFNTVVVKRDGNPNADTYTVTITHGGAALIVEPNTTATLTTNPKSKWAAGAFNTLYKAGDKIKIPAYEATGGDYLHIGYSASEDSEDPEYAIGEEITVTQAMVTAGVIDLYMIWSKYKLGELVTNVTDIDGKTQTGYVVYVHQNGLYDFETLKAASSKPSAAWRYIIVSKYGANKLTDITWADAKASFNGSNGIYLPSKTEMDKIGSLRLGEARSSYLGNSEIYYWTKTSDTNGKPIYARWYYFDTTSSWVLHTDSTTLVNNNLNAIGISYLP